MYSGTNNKYPCTHTQYIYTYIHIYIYIYKMNKKYTLYETQCLEYSTPIVHLAEWNFWRVLTKTNQN